MRVLLVHQPKERSSACKCIGSVKLSGLAKAFQICQCDELIIQDTGVFFVVLSLLLWRFL